MRVRTTTDDCEKLHPCKSQCRVMFTERSRARTFSRTKNYPTPVSWLRKSNGLPTHQRRRIQEVERNSAMRCHRSVTSVLRSPATTSSAANDQLGVGQG